LAASTKIRLDHGAAVSVLALCIAGHNLSSTATITWSRGTTTGATDVYAGSAVNAWQITPQTYDGRAYSSVLVLPQAYSARHDLIEISDTTNTAGYVEISRVFVGAVWVPTYNVGYGLQDGIEDLSSTDRSDGGSLWTTQRRKLRYVQAVLEALTTTEADTMHNMQMAAGTTEEVLYLPDLASTSSQQRYGFLATMEELSPIEYPYFRQRALPLRLKEAA
jgi:hypothetical protein